MARKNAAPTKLTTMPPQNPTLPGMKALSRKPPMNAPTTPTTMSATQPKPRPATTREAMAPAMRPMRTQPMMPPGWMSMVASASIPLIVAENALGTRRGLARPEHNDAGHGVGDCVRGEQQPGERVGDVTADEHVAEHVVAQRDRQGGKHGVPVDRQPDEADEHHLEHLLDGHHALVDQLQAGHGEAHTEHC